MMELLLAVLTVATVLISQTLAQVEFCDLYPMPVQKCFKQAMKHPVDAMDARTACIKRFYLDIIPDLNLTKSDREFFSYRAKTKFGRVPPPSGPRIRKEYRRLSKEERFRLHRAFNILYKEGVVQRFGRLHAAGAVARSIHDGPAFLPWHRVFIADFEEELRRVDPKVSLAYWDQTMDVNMTKPSDSVIWSPCFFGNGAGPITQGPFRGWYGGRFGPLQRDFSRGMCDTGRLINKKDLLNVLSRCRLQEISKPPNGLPFNVESLHDGTHLWVGGDMGELTLSAFEPIFYFHHAFTDYIWELFRRNQFLRCGVDPAIDYPMNKKRVPPGHRAFDRMLGYEYLNNIDGINPIFTKAFYQYETLPTCPDCGHSKFLYCDLKRKMCVSRDQSACNLPPNPWGTFTGGDNEDTEIGFNGEIEPATTIFPKHQPFHNFLPADRRSHEMTYEQSMEVAIQQEGENFYSKKLPFLPFSPIKSLYAPFPPKKMLMEGGPQPLGIGLGPDGLGIGIPPLVPGKILSGEPAFVPLTGPLHPPHGPIGHFGPPPYRPSIYIPHPQVGYYK